MRPTRESPRRADWKERGKWKEARTSKRAFSYGYTPFIRHGRTTGPLTVLSLNISWPEFGIARDHPLSILSAVLTVNATSSCAWESAVQCPLACVETIRAVLTASANKKKRRKKKKKKKNTSIPRLGPDRCPDVAHRKIIRYRWQIQRLRPSLFARVRFHFHRLIHVHACNRCNLCDRWSYTWLSAQRRFVRRFCKITTAKILRESIEINSSKDVTDRYDPRTPPHLSKSRIFLAEELHLRL